MDRNKDKPAPNMDDLLQGQALTGSQSKRIGRRPLLVVFGLVVLALLAFCYSLYDRSVPKTGNKPANTPLSVKPSVQSGKIVVLEGKQTTGIVPEGVRIEPAAVQSSDLAALSDKVLKPDGAPRSAMMDPQRETATYGPRSTGQTSALENPYAQQWADHNEEARAARKARSDALIAAIGSDSGIQMAQKQGQDNNGSRPSPSSLAMNGLFPPQLPSMSSMPSTDQPDPSGQGSKRSFLSSNPPGKSYLDARREVAVSPFEVKAGTVVNAKLVTGISSDLPGQIIGMVDRDVFDTSTGRYVLIPQGSRLVGGYDSSVSFGQSRVLVAWYRIIFADGSSIDIGSMPGVDRSGKAGFVDKVNNHYTKTFGSAAMMSLFSAGVQLSQPQSTNGQNQSTSQTISAALGQQTGQLGMEIARKNLQIQPNLEIRPGYKFNILITKDIILKPVKS